MCCMQFVCWTQYAGNAVVKAHAVNGLPCRKKDHQHVLIVPCANGVTIIKQLGFKLAIEVSILAQGAKHLHDKRLRCGELLADAAWPAVGAILCQACDARRCKGTCHSRMMGARCTQVAMTRSRSKT